MMLIVLERLRRVLLKNIPKTGGPPSFRLANSRSEMIQALAKHPASKSL
jgi:hypothetical protein